MNLGGFPTYASLTLPTLPSRPAPATRRLAAKYPLEESEIMPIVCQPPGFTPDHINASLSTGVPFSLTPNTNQNPTSFGVTWLPHGLSLNTATGNISGAPSSPGTFTVTLTCSNACGSGTATLNLMITGSAPPDSTPWPVNLARKGTVAFADLTTLPSIANRGNPDNVSQQYERFSCPYCNQPVNGMAKLCYNTTADFCLFRQPLISLGLGR